MTSYTSYQENNFKLFDITDPLYVQSDDIFHSKKFIQDEIQADPVTNFLKLSKFRKNIVLAGDYVASMVDPLVEHHRDDTVQELYIFGNAREVRLATKDLISIVKRYMKNCDIGYILLDPNETNENDKIILSIVIHFHDYLYPIIINPTRCPDMRSVVNTMLTTCQQVVVSYQFKVPRVLGTKRFIDAFRTNKINITTNKTDLSVAEIQTISNLSYLHGLDVPKAFEDLLVEYQDSMDWFQPRKDFKFGKSKYEVMLRWPDADYYQFFHTRFTVDQIYNCIRRFLVRETPRNKSLEEMNEDQIEEETEDDLPELIPN